jgi:hypothetical protein
MMIEHYATGSYMRVDGKDYHKDLKIIGGQVIGNWWRKQGHRLHVEDVTDILSAKPELLVIGTGYAGNMRIPESVRFEIENRNISIIAEETARAVAIFNRLASEGKDVAGAFHLTC